MPCDHQNSSASIRSQAGREGSNAPFTSTPRHNFGFGANGFCGNCRLCEDGGPPVALSPDQRMVRGARRCYVLDFGACISVFAETSGCALCIAFCPWSRPGVGIDAAAQLAFRSARHEP